MDMQTITKGELLENIKELNDQIKTLPPEKRLEMLKEINAYLRGLSMDITALDKLFKEDKIEELKNQKPMTSRR